MTAERPVVAAFDVDGTLTVRDCLRPFLRRLGGRGALVLPALRHPGAVVQAAARRDSDVVKALVVRSAYRGRRHADVDALGADFAIVIEREMLRPDTLARLRWHQRQGHRTVIVSASMGAYLRPLADRLGVDAVLCTDVTLDGDRYTGVLDHGNCRGREKARRLRAWMAERGLSDATVWAYGNSRGDRELLQLADHPTLVAARPIPADGGLDLVAGSAPELTIEGWMTTAQLGVLRSVATSTRSGDRIVEIGSFRGRSTVALARSAPAGVDIIAIDPYDGSHRGPGEISGFGAAAGDDRNVFHANLEATGTARRVRHVAATSAAALTQLEGTVAVVLVDGSHRARDASADIRGWGGRLAPGGTLVVHDAFSSVGVTAAIGRRLLLSPCFRYRGRTGSLATYTLDLDGSLRARTANAARQLAQLPWFARNLAVKCALRAGLGTLLRLAGRTAPAWPH